jgi:hypothetical protein
MGRKKKADDTSVPFDRDHAGNEAASTNLGVLKDELRAKYWLLRDEPLDFDELEALLTHVAEILGVGLPKLRHDIEDL